MNWVETRPVESTQPKHKTHIEILNFNVEILARKIFSPMTPKLEILVLAENSIKVFALCNIIYITTRNVLQIVKFVTIIICYHILRHQLPSQTFVIVKIVTALSYWSK